MDGKDERWDHVLSAVILHLHSEAQLEWYDIETDMYISLSELNALSLARNFRAHQIDPSMNAVALKRITRPHGENSNSMRALLLSKFDRSARFRVDFWYQWSELRFDHPPCGRDKADRTKQHA